MKDRVAPRTRTMLTGQAIVSPALAPIACAVRDLSDLGARIATEPPHVLPDQFELSIPKRNIHRRVEVRWREGLTIGVAFALAPREDEAGRRLTELEAENAQLKKRIAEMAIILNRYGESERFGGVV